MKRDAKAASIAGLLMRAVRKPPRVLARRALNELSAELNRYAAPRRHRRFRDRAILRVVPSRSIEALWARLSAMAFVGAADIDEDVFAGLCPGAAREVRLRARKALDHEVDLLGSGPVDLGTTIDWHKDYKTGYRWPAAFHRDIDYNNKGRASDVKFPWELSRLQWLLPLGQAYLLTGEERYAAGCRDIITDWIDANPYAQGVNWACTMEVALRILSMTWLFHAFKHSPSWARQPFQSLFLHSLYLHAEFTEKHLERSDINGNHYTADAAGLVFAGLFFGRGTAARRWSRTGWRILCEELPRQVLTDGVDFEASVAYHRLVTELFFLPALYRLRRGLDVPDFYRARLKKMAAFTRAYSRVDGSVPLWGDADDARALPLGSQGVNDHRYLPQIIGVAFDWPDLIDVTNGSCSELFWLHGAARAEQVAARSQQPSQRRSAAFVQAGVYIMQNDIDHVFIDCGPVGLAGRGGHGHNDCLSFEAVLAGVKLISDCGAYLYTGSYRERNRFRSTVYHNTPKIDAEEINRFIRPDYLWNLRYDALPQVRRWSMKKQRDLFVGAHSGYARLQTPITPVRTLMLDHARHVLLCRDCFEGSGAHRVEIPLHLAPGVEVARRAEQRLILSAGGRKFTLLWHAARSWTLVQGRGRVSPSYGRYVPITRLVWRRPPEHNAPLAIALFPGDGRLDADLEHLLEIHISYEST